jgi:hypothetical protein
MFESKDILAFEAKKRSTSVLRHISNKSSLTDDDIRSDLEAMCEKMDQMQV